MRASAGFLLLLTAIARWPEDDAAISEIATDALGIFAMTALYEA